MPGAGQQRRRANIAALNRTFHEHHPFVGRTAPPSGGRIRGGAVGKEPARQEPVARTTYQPASPAGTVRPRRVLHRRGWRHSHTALRKRSNAALNGTPSAATITN